MLIDSKSVGTILKLLRSQEVIAVDTETTGLEPYKHDLPFAIIIATKDYAFTLFLNQHSSPLKEQISDFLREFKGVVIFHNAKFDLAMLEKVGIVVGGDIYCTMAEARLYDNTLLSLQLSDLAKLVGEKKSDEVKKYCLTNNIWEWEHKAGAKKKSKKLFYDKVPLEILMKYAEQDARITYKLYTLFESSKGYPEKLSINERKLTRTLYQMEKVGILLDVDYITKSIADQEIKLSVAKEKFKEITGVEFKDSNKALAEVYNHLNLPYNLTEKGNPTFNEENLKKLDSPLSNVIMAIREHEGRIVSYKGLIASADEHGVIHSNAKQSGCVTGRMSYSNPPMQCMEKIDPKDYTPEEYAKLMPIRKAFIPRPGFFFCMMDYDQFEYRMMINAAGEKKLQEKILSGLCVHTATAQMLGITRKQAKTINFSLLYGSGVDNLARSLNVKTYEARKFKEQYFSELPFVENFINSVINYCKNNKSLTNWAGRKFTMTVDEAYRGPNYYIQSGTAEWVKIAMNKISVFLQDKKSRMLLQIHDELLFEIHESEKEIIPKIKEIMENISDAKIHQPLKYTVGIDYSWKNWQDKEEYEL